MKKIKNVLKLILASSLVMVIISLQSCSEDEVTNYDVTFWNAETNVGQITVTIDGKTAVITQTVSSTPECKSSGNANFTLTAGSYPWSATATTGESWSGTEVVGAALCTTIELN